MMQALSLHPAVKPASLLPTANSAAAAVPSGDGNSAELSSSTLFMDDNAREDMTTAPTLPQLPPPLRASLCQGYCSHCAPKATSPQTTGLAPAAMAAEQPEEAGKLAFPAQQQPIPQPDAGRPGPATYSTSCSNHMEPVRRPNQDTVRNPSLLPLFLSRNLSRIESSWQRGNQPNQSLREHCCSSQTVKRIVGTVERLRLHMLR